MKDPQDPGTIDYVPARRGRRPKSHLGPMTAAQRQAAYRARWAADYERLDVLVARPVAATLRELAAQHGWTLTEAVGMAVLALRGRAKNKTKKST